MTSGEGKLGDTFLKAFRDNEKTIPTILTTSQKLSTGVDARNVRFIVLMRGVGSMIEFKQIVGRGTRIYEGKDYFTIVDFNDNIGHFSDPEWDGEPIADVEVNALVDMPVDTGCSLVAEVPESPYRHHGADDGDPDDDRPQKLEIRLPDGKIRTIMHTVETIYFGADGKAMSPREFLEQIFGQMPQFFASEDELRTIWANPATRQRLLAQLADNGFDDEKLEVLRDIIDAKDSDMYDVLRYVAFAKDALSREYRATHIDAGYFNELSEDEELFVRFVLDKYTSAGEQELADRNLGHLLELQYHSLNDAVHILGVAPDIKEKYHRLQEELYSVS